MQVDGLTRRLSESQRELIEAATASTGGSSQRTIVLLDHVSFWRERTLHEIRELVRTGRGTGRFDVAFTHHLGDVTFTDETEHSPDLDAALGRLRAVYEQLLDYLQRLESPDFDIESSPDAESRNTVRSLLMADVAHTEEHAAELRRDHARPAEQ